MSGRLRPEVLFELVASHVPRELQPHILIIGSIAAAYHHRDSLYHDGITTKDADVMIQPAGAINECQTIAQRLLDGKWRRVEKAEGRGCFPRDSEDHPDLRAIRLWPPSSDAYFVELLALPAISQVERLKWIPIKLADGWYGLPSFRFLGLVQHDRKMSSSGLMYASPVMMALANLLSHPRLGHERMSEPIDGRSLLRSAKDLGRVLALARLTARDELAAWASAWKHALERSFPEEHRALARRAGDGLRALLADPDALDEARHTADVGLLHGYQITAEQLAAIGRQLLVDAIEPLEREGRSDDDGAG
jgi:hypothetical protein